MEKSETHYFKLGVLRKTYSVSSWMYFCVMLFKDLFSEGHSECYWPDLVGFIFPWPCSMLLVSKSFYIITRYSNFLCSSGLCYWTLGCKECLSIFLSVQEPKRVSHSSNFKNPWEVSHWCDVIYPTLDKPIGDKDLG